MGYNHIDMQRVLLRIFVLLLLGATATDGESHSSAIKKLNIKNKQPRPKKQEPRSKMTVDHMKIAWVHFPKAGTSFGNALVHLANSSLPPKLSVKIPGGPNVDAFVAKFPYEKWFRGVFWTKKSGNFANHDSISIDTFNKWRGHFFAMFR